MTAALSAKTHRPGGVAELMAIALPMVISQACETVMMFTDRLFLSRLGPEYMSASMGGGLNCFLFMTFFLGLTGYSNALVAQYLGAGRKELCARATTQALLITLAAWPVMILVGVPGGHWLFAFSHPAPEQLGPQTEYFDILMYATGLGLLRNCFGCFFSGIGRTRVVMLASGVALAVNACANYALIFGHFGLPRLGIAGAAYGTILGSASGLLVLALRYFAPAVRAEFGVWAALRYDRELMAKLWRWGTPSGVEFFLNLLAFDLLVMSFHSYGKNEAAAMTITLNWDMLSFIPLIGVGIGVTSLVGRYMGAGQPELANRSTYSGLKVAVAYTGVTFTAFCIFPQTMAGIFLPPAGTPEYAQIAPLAVFMLRLVVIYLFADALTIVFSSALRGAGDTFWTMVISVAGHWAFALNACFMVWMFKIDPRWTWLTTNFLIVGLGTSFYLRYRTGRWRELKVVDEAPPPPLHEDQEIHL